MSLRLPAPLEAHRRAYDQEIRSSLEDVEVCFQSWGVPVSSQTLIDAAVLFDSTVAAREHLARVFEVPISSLPETFAGTVVERTLFLVSREAYRETWRGLYSDWPWTERTYRQLVVHELAHRAHEALALSRAGSAEAMGPTWFFEGLAVACAGQFDEGRPLMDRAAIRAHVGSGRTPAVSYPLYGRLVRSLIALHDLDTLLRRASDPGFPEVLWSETSADPSFPPRQ